MSAKARYEPHHGEAVEVLEAHGWRHGAEVGGEVRGPCVFHNGKGPNLSVNLLKNTWYCNSECQKGGDLEEIWALYGMQNRFASTGPSLEDLDILRSNLKSEDGAEAREYLTKRGLIRDTLDRFQIGLSFRLQYNELSPAWRITIPVADERDELLYYRRHHHPSATFNTPAALALPDGSKVSEPKQAGDRAKADFEAACPACGQAVLLKRSHTGKQVECAGCHRQLNVIPTGSEKRKMTGPKGHPIAIFGANLLASLRKRASEFEGDPPTVFIVEGEWDRLMMAQNEFDAVCSTGGAGGWNEDWAEKFDGLDVVILLDADKAGATGAAKILRNLQQRGRCSRIRVPKWPFKPEEKLPNGGKPKDASDWFNLGHTADEVWEFVNASESLDRGTPSDGANGANGTLHVIQGGGGDANDRAIIRVVPELWNMSEQARDILISKEESLYNRSGVLVTVHTRTRRNLPAYMRAEDYALGGAFLDPVSPIELVGLMSRHMTFVQQKRGEWEPVQPPENLAKLLVARGGGEWPQVTRVSSAPTLRRDGTIFATPGYDQLTGCLFVPPVGVKYDAVLENPSRQDALDAYNVLTETFANFPFVDCDLKPIRLGHDPVTISAILTIHAAGFCSRRPIHHCQAPAKGSGKTYWVLAVAICATGRVYPVWIPSGDAEEERKELMSIALSGEDVLLADNLDGPFGSARLAAFVTSGAIQGRVMGLNQMKTVYANVAMLTNGSNTQFQNTLERRVVPTYIDAQMEDPEDRDRKAFTYQGTPVDYALKHRNRIVPAGLTLLKAYQQYRKSGGPAPMRHAASIGSFEDWEDFVRDPVLWLGKRDPLSNRAKQREQHDFDRENRHVLIESFYAVYPDPNARIRPADIVRLEEKAGGPRRRSMMDDTTDTLTDAERQLLEAVRGRDGRLRAKSVGFALSKIQDVVIKLVSGAKVALRKTYADGYPVYWVQVIEPPPPKPEADADAAAAALAAQAEASRMPAHLLDGSPDGEY